MYQFLLNPIMIYGGFCISSFFFYGENNVFMLNTGEKTGN